MCVITETTRVKNRCNCKPEDFLSALVELRLVSIINTSRNVKKKHTFLITDSPAVSSQCKQTHHRSRSSRVPSEADALLLDWHHTKNSFVLSQKDCGHVLVYYKGDTAGRGDPDNVGNDAFVETSGSFVPEVKKKRFRMDGSVSSSCFSRSSTAPPRPSDDIQHAVVTIVLVL